MAGALFTAPGHLWPCVFQLLGALSLPIQIKGCTNTNTSFTSQSAAGCTEGLPEMLFDTSLTMLKTAQHQFVEGLRSGRLEL